MRFDLTDLHLFVAVVDAGSITHGAAAAGLSLPAASERLRAMEAAGGVALLDRGRRGVEPTEAGLALLHHARLVLHQMAELRGDLGRHARGLRASVRVLANTAALAEVLPDRLAPWLAAHPQVDLDLRERQSPDIARSLLSGFAEIGILSQAASAEGLLAHPFALDRLVVVVDPGHALAAQRRPGFGEVLDFPLVTLAEGALQAHLEAQAARLGRRLRSRLAVRGFEAICRLVGAGVGPGIVPESAARRVRRAAGIRVLPLADPWATRRLVVATRADAPLTRAAGSLFAHLAQAAGG